MLSIDAENQRLSLGLKQLQTGIWKEFFDAHHVGDIVEGKVVRLTNFGAFVELADGIEGLIHVSEFDSSQGGEKLELRAGETYQMKIIRLVPEERKIGLSIRALKDAGVPRRLGGLHRIDRPPGSDAGGSLQASEVKGSGLRALGSGLWASMSPEAQSPEPSVQSPQPSSMTKAELVEEVSRVSDLTKKHSEVIVDTVFKSIVDALHRGEKIELRGFGSFRLRQREPRKGRNPKTGDKVDVPPKKVPYFKPGKELKDLINRAIEEAGADGDPDRLVVNPWIASGRPGVCPT